MVNTPLTVVAAPSVMVCVEDSIYRWLNVMVPELRSVFAGEFTVTVEVP